MHADPGTADALPQFWPPFGVRVTCGPLMMRAVRDTDFPEVLDVVRAGVHEPERMPFLVPWTDARGAELERTFVQYHWQQRARLSPESWSLDLAVWYDGALVGMQGVSTKDFLVTRTGETGSWLGRQFHRRGIGTLMRQVICVLSLDHLDFTQVTSGAFGDNPASLGVSRRVGYRVEGTDRVARRGRVADHVRLALAPADLVRPPYDVGVSGVGPFRQLIGLDQPDAT